LTGRYASGPQQPGVAEQHLSTLNNGDIMQKQYIIEITIPTDNKPEWEGSIKLIADNTVYSRRTISLTGLLGELTEILYQDTTRTLTD
jgi:threonine dehydrogenase-like Zn-dependent dehydrogenase